MRNKFVQNIKTFVFIWIYFCSQSILAQVSFGERKFGTTSNNNFQGCITVGGPDIGKGCVFPFIHDGITYTGCPIDPDDSTKRWCSTRTDGSGNHITGKGVYGECSPGCPIQDGFNPAVSSNQDFTSGGSSQQCLTEGGPDPYKPCSFPFIYEGTTYYGCPIDPEVPGKRWCSTQVDSSGNHITGGGHYGHCSSNCPIHSDSPASPGSCQGNQLCRPFSVCSAQISLAELATSCTQSDGSPGLCCREITDNPSILGGSLISIRSQTATEAGDNRDLSSIPSTTVRSAVDVADSFSQNVSTSARGASGAGVIFPKTASFKHFQFLKTEPGMSQLGNTAITAMFTAKSLSASEFGSDIEVRSGVRQFGFSNVDISATILQKDCPPDPVCDFNSRYRTIDGSCNNVRVPKFGKTGTPLQRILPNAYADGFFLPRVSKDGTQLPSPRVVSNGAVSTVEISSNKFTSLLMNFGQLIDHDLTHVPVHDDESGGPLNCCPPNDNFSATQDPSNLLVCLPIQVPPNDRRITRRCINNMRSRGAPALNCQPGPIQQMNQINHWLDGAQIYGNDNTRARNLRQMSRGLLKVQLAPDGGELLPNNPNTTVKCGEIDESCFITGDARVNEQPGLAVMHTLFLREHNRVARRLAEINPHWAGDDERLYQETRRIVVAQWQHIVYNEWLPIILGRQFMEHFGLYPLTSGYSNDYRNDFNPSITNAFAVAGFRIGHTLIPGTIELFAGKGRQKTETLPLKEVFFNVDSVRKANGFAQILKGQTLQPAQTPDSHFSGSIVNNLFDGEPRGFDLVALNIQRSRDHGVPGYVKFREICQIGKANSFEDLASNMSPQNIAQLRSVYKDVEDIDLFIGMSFEDPAPRQGAIVGKTFLCLIGDQFARLKLGDRFFYDLAGQAGSFTEAQLNEIRRTSLARLICDNTPQIHEMQPFALQMPHTANNPLLSCRGGLNWGIQSVNLEVFRE